MYIFKIIVPIAAMFLVGCNAKNAIPQKALGSPIVESKFYKLFPGHLSSEVFEGSGVQVVGDYFYEVFDNSFQLAKIHNSLAASNPSNTLVGSNTSSSNFEGITFQTHPGSSFYVVEETAKNGQDYFPRISEYDSNLNLINTRWTDYLFSSGNSNKGFEGLAWVKKAGVDYLIGLVEGTGKMPVMKLENNQWVKFAEMGLPSGVSFSDYSDMAIYNNSKLAVVSQEESKMWVGQLNTDNWTIVEGGTIFTFPTGDANGNIGTGGKILYGNVEGVSFIDSETVVVCSDKISSSQPSYQDFKAECIHVFKLN